MMGHMACRVFRERHEVVGVCRKAALLQPLLPTLGEAVRVREGVDCLDLPVLRQVLEAAAPGAVLNCVGLVKQLEAAKDPRLSIRVNSLFPHELAALCTELGAKLITLSTDCVFSGKRGGYSEDDTPDPVDLYGASKLLGEVAYDGHLTVRSSIVGRQLRGATGLFEWFFSQRGGKVKGFTGAIYSGLTTAALCRVLSAVLAEHSDLGGIWHIASTPIDKYELLSRANRLAGLGIGIDPDDTFQCDRSLDGSRFERETGIRVPSWDAMLEEFTEDAVSYESWRS